MLTKTKEEFERLYQNDDDENEEVEQSQHSAFNFVKVSFSKNKKKIFDSIFFNLNFRLVTYF